MQLASRLRETTLGDLLAALFRSSATGVLELVEPHARHAIHLRRGYVQAIETPGTGLRLGDIAARAYGVPRPIVERARMVAHARGIRIGQALVAMDAIAPEHLAALLAVQQQRRLESLYGVRDAEVRFRVSRPLPAGTSEQAPLPPHHAFHGRPRRRPRPAGAERVPMQGPSVDRAHAVLGVTAAATPTEVRAAFRRLVLELHPDRAHDATEAVKAERARRLVDVIAAYRSVAADQ